jgi:predicted phage terminase large subunit-like protein
MAIRPQSGPQEAFLSSPADIAIYGGGAGGGKTWALLLEPLRHSARPDFSAVIFRRNLVQVTNPGGLWDEAAKLYGVIPGAKSTLQPLQWSVEQGKIRFAHLQDEKTVYDWQGSQIPLLCFDELTHFSRAQFFYMLSRNRSMCGIKPYIRCTCNPDAESWVAEFIAWWLDPATGLPIPARSGVLRWFIRVGDALLWADAPEGLPVQATPDGQVVSPKSVTFIPAKLTDNAALMAADPGYCANLMSLPTVERERLLGGNWKIRPAAGMFFQRSWCEVVDAAPAGLSVVRYWDLAATPKIEGNDPDWTIGLKLGKSADGTYYVLHVARLREAPAGVEAALKNTAAADGRAVRVGLPQDPGQAGKSQAAYFVKQLHGFTVSTARESGGKVTRFGPVSSQARAGNVKFLRGPWLDDVFVTLEGFPDAAHDDDADALSGAFEMFQGASTGLLDFYASVRITD